MGITCPVSSLFIRRCDRGEGHPTGGHGYVVFSAAHGTNTLATALEYKIPLEMIYCGVDESMEAAVQTGQVR